MSLPGDQPTQVDLPAVPRSARLGAAPVRLVEEPVGQPGQQPDPPGRRRVVRLRRIEPASVLKVALVLCLLLMGLVLLAGIGLWSWARSAGLVDHLEGLAREFGFEDFRLLPGRMMTYALLIGPLLALVGALLCVAATCVTNLVLRIVGGVAVSVEDQG